MAHKHPIEMLVGKNFEVHQLQVAVNKGEIKNPDAEFIFWAGDDETEEDIFRALHVFSPDMTGRAHLKAPLSVTLVKDTNSVELPSVELTIASGAIFTTAVGHRSKSSLASWDDGYGMNCHLKAPARPRSMTLKERFVENQDPQSFRPEKAVGLIWMRHRRLTPIRPLKHSYDMSYDPVP